MRTFSSYGPVNRKLHYHASRDELVEKAYDKLIGESSAEGGHYITVWAPRQTGKTWIMMQVARKIKELDDFKVAIITLQSAKEITTDEGVLDLFVKKLKQKFEKEFPKIKSWENLRELFTKKYFEKPLILILDEFDALKDTFINKFANEFRDIYLDRLNEEDRKTNEKSCLLHGLALIGVRGVLGIDTDTGSPFNVQRSLQIPNLTFNEVKGMFTCYEKEKKQKVEHNVIEQLYYETNGQPGFVSWFGELLTEIYNNEKDKPITLNHFNEVYHHRSDSLPNTNILNIISKAKKDPNKNHILELFKTEQKIKFKFDDIELNYLYMNGIIDIERADDGDYIKFASPFIQKRLFYRFSNDVFNYVGEIYKPFENLDHVITKDSINVRNLMKLYQSYLDKNKDWLLKDAPRRSDLNVYEAVYHFNLYMYLVKFMRSLNGSVYPEFPTGNGQIDLIIKYNSHIIGLELKSFTNKGEYEKALVQAAKYGGALKLNQISLIIFIGSIDDRNRKKYEIDYIDEKTNVKVEPIFIITGG